LFQQFRSYFATYSADFGMAWVTVVWGFHYIVIKDAVQYFNPITFNALRFALALPVFFFIAARNRHVFRFERRDLLMLIGMTLIGLVGYQVLFVTAVQYTTSTNAALLIATMPLWTAVFSIVLGTLSLRRGLMIGLAITLFGVIMVVLSRAGANFSMSSDDLIGSAMALLAAVIFAIYLLASKPFVDRYGGLSNALVKQWVTAFGLLVLAMPDIITLRPSDFPLKLLPNFLYSGLLACVGGYLISNYAIGKIGPARTAMYNNFAPLFAAFGGILLLHEHMTGGLLIGGALTMVGVNLVRRQMRPGRRELIRQTVSIAAGD
jgi:drug/metabolite transporter (DMT)-like permease